MIFVIRCRREIVIFVWSLENPANLLINSNFYWFVYPSYDPWKNTLWRQQSHFSTISISLIWSSNCIKFTWRTLQNLPWWNWMFFFPCMAKCSRRSLTFPVGLNTPENSVNLVHVFCANPDVLTVVRACSPSLVRQLYRR